LGLQSLCGYVVIGAEQPDQDGGVLFTLMDTTMAWAAWSQLDEGYNCATVNLDIHYTLPAKSDSFLCTAWNTHKTKRISFMRADSQNSKG
jgi:acyl-coenzyme A thioesterase PaaI-like protein